MAPELALLEQEVGLETPEVLSNPRYLWSCKLQSEVMKLFFKLFKIV